jgi:cell division protein FtsB
LIRKRLFQIGVVVIIAVSVMMLWRFFAGNNGLWKQHRIAKQVEALQHEADSLNLLLQEKKVEEQRLLTDTFYIESIARTHFGMSKEGEKAFQFIDQGSRPKADAP